MTCWPYFGTEDDLLELGERFYAASDEAFVIEKRLAKALGIQPSLNHWRWYRPEEVL